MKKDFFRGIYIALGIIFTFSLLGLVYAVGFHIAEEILPGTFTGEYSFNGSVGIGTTNPSSSLDVKGDFIRNITYVSKTDDGGGTGDGTDSGQIISRVLNFTKKYNETKIRIGYTDNWRITAHANACQWELRVDDFSCSPALNFSIYDSDSATNVQSTHRQGTFFGYCEGVNAGTVEIQVWVDTAPGYVGADCYTGWNGRWTIEAEEVY